MPEPLFFNEVNNNRPQPGILLKKTLVFYDGFCAFLKTPFFIEHVRRLFLHVHIGQYLFINVPFTAYSK